MVRVRAIEDGFPFYGSIETIPAPRWSQLLEGKTAQLVADSDIPTTLGLKEGDVLSLGNLRFRLSGVFIKKPGNPAASFSFAPTVYIHRSKYLAGTGLLGQGSRVRYKRMFQTPADFDLQAWKDRNWNKASQSNLTIQSFQESDAGLQRFLNRFSYFSTIVGLVTL